MSQVVKLPLYAGESTTSGRARACSSRPLVALAFVLLAIFSIVLTGNHKTIGSTIAQAAKPVTALLPGNPPCGALAVQAEQPVPAEKPFRFLYLIGWNDQESLMDRWYQRLYQAFVDAPDLVQQAEIWGPGWTGWSNGLTVAENIAARFGRPNYFDAVMPYYRTDADNRNHHDSTPLFHEYAELTRLGVILADRPHELREEARFPYYSKSNMTLVMAPYGQELLEYRRFSKHTLMVHIPHPVDSSIFYADVEAEREHDVMLAGASYPSLYPFRHRLDTLIRESKLPAYIRPHPGYADVLTMEERIRQGIDAATQDSQVRDFAADLANSKICLVTGTKYHYSVQKYSEAAAAGCMIVGTVPYDRTQDYASFVVQVHYDDSEEQIRATVQEYLDNKELRLEKARAAQQYFLTSFTNRHYVEDVKKYVRLAQTGQRGTVLPFDYNDLEPDNDG